MIGGIITLILWWWVGGFDWYSDYFDCTSYIDICKKCEIYILINIDFTSFERWQFSMLNKIRILYPWLLNEDYYLDTWQINLLYRDDLHQGMFSLIYNNDFINVDKSGFWKIIMNLR